MSHATLRAALAGVLAAGTLDEAHAVACAELKRLDAAAQVDASDILEVAEAAELAGVTEATIRKWLARYGRTPRRFGHRLGGRWLLSRSRFEAFIAGGLHG